MNGECMLPGPFSLTSKKEVVTLSIRRTVKIKGKIYPIDKMEKVIQQLINAQIILAPDFFCT